MWMKRFAAIILSLAMLLSGMPTGAWAEGDSGCSGAVHDRSQVDEYVSFYTVALSYGTNAGNDAEEYNNEVCVGTTVDVRFSCKKDIPFNSVYVEGEKTSSSQWEAVSYASGSENSWSCRFTAMETGNTPPATVKLHAKCVECGEEEVYSYTPNLAVTECRQKYVSSSAQGEPEYEMIDGDSASHLVVQNASVSCWLCGKTTEKLEETVESHAFDESGRCVCGYQKQSGIAAPEWEKKRVDVFPEDTVYLFYKVDSAAKYVRLEYETYTAEGVLTGSYVYDTYKVARRLFGNELYTTYLYTVFQSNNVEYGLTGFSEGTITKFYLTACDENKEDISERSEAFEVRCAIPEDTGETITLTVSPSGEIVENTTLTFTAVSNSESVKLCIDAFNGETGERYTAVTKNMNRDGTTFTAENQFTAPGRKIVWAETAGGVKSEEIEITVTAAEIQLVAPEYTGATAATVGEPITLSWTEVDGAVGYTAWLRPADNTEDVTNLSERIVNQSAVYTFAEAGVYYLQIYSVGAEGSGTSEPCNVTLTVAEAACEHLNHANDTYLKTEYRSIGSDSVHEKRDVYTHSCTDCGASLPNVYTDWAEEAHEDDGNGYCWKCQTTIGEQAGEVCPHANARAYYDDGALPPRFSSITETHHDVQNGYRMYCEDCGQYTGETGYFEAVSEEHDFTGGDVCVCGYDRSGCAHTPAEGSALYLHTIFQAKDEKTHLAAADVYQYTCGKCGQVYEETFARAEGQQETLAHSWKDGVCQELGCGYACGHAEYGWNGCGRGTTEKIDDQRHRYTFPVVYFCTNCDVTWLGTESTEGEHSMITRTEYEVQDSTCHLVKKYSVCSSGCGMKKLISETTAEHTPDQYGKCTVCEYENAELLSQEAFREELYKLYEEMIRTVDEASIVDYCTIDTSSAKDAVVTFGSATLRRASTSLSELLFDDFVESVKGDGSNDYLNTAADIAELLGFYYDEQREIVEAMVLTEILEAEVEANLYYTAIKKNGGTIAKILKRGASDDLKDLKKDIEKIKEGIEKIEEEQIIAYFHDENIELSNERLNERLAALQAELETVKKGMNTTEIFVTGISGTKQLFDLGGHFYEENLEYNTLVYMRKNVREKLVTLSGGIADETLRAAVEEYIEEIDNALKNMLMSDCVYVVKNAQSYAKTYYQFTNWLCEKGILKNKTVAQKAIQATKEKWEEVTNQIKENKIIGFGAEALKNVKKVVNYFEIASMFGNMMYSIDDLVHLYDVISYERLALEKQADRILSIYNRFYDASELVINKPNLNSEIVSAIALTSATQTHLHKYWNTIYNDTYIVEDGISVLGFFEIYAPECIVPSIRGLLQSDEDSLAEMEAILAVICEIEAMQKDLSEVNDSIIDAFESLEGISNTNVYLTQIK